MINDNIVTDENFLIYAAKHYDGISGAEDLDFLEDISRIVYIKRLLNKFTKSGDLKERLILNHIIILHNVFGSSCIPMLFLKMPEYKSELKTFLNYLSLMPDEVPYGANIVNTGDIPVHYIIAQRLISQWQA